MSVTEDWWTLVLKANLVMREFSNISLNTPLVTLKTDMWSNVISPTPWLDGLFTPHKIRACGFTHVAFKTVTEGGCRISWLYHPCCCSNSSTVIASQIWGHNPQTRGSLKRSHQYRKGKKHLCTSGERSQQWSRLPQNGGWQQLRLWSAWSIHVSRFWQQDKKSCKSTFCG